MPFGMGQKRFQRAYVPASDATSAGNCSSLLCWWEACLLELRGESRLLLEVYLLLLKVCLLLLLLRLTLLL